ncbi:hypothetical protein GB937_002284 [Aspergillus fischeri]|nr:hypothetical protein GB937_002284 [Aspergillus fischeri]
MAAAVVLLARLQAAQVLTKGKTSRDSAWWMDSLNHNGMMAFNCNLFNLPCMVKYGFVWRRFNWGAGQYRSINKAIRTSSSVTGALVYFPPGKYQVSSSIVAMYNSQLVGDTTDLPTIRAASSLLAWVLSGLTCTPTVATVPNGISTRITSSARPATLSSISARLRSSTRLVYTDKWLKRAKYPGRDQNGPASSGFGGVVETYCLKAEITGDCGWLLLVDWIPTAQ